MSITRNRSAEELRRLIRLYRNRMAKRLEVKTYGWSRILDDISRLFDGELDGVFEHSSYEKWFKRERSLSDKQYRTLEHFINNPKFLNIVPEARNSFQADVLKLQAKHIASLFRFNAHELTRVFISSEYTNQYSGVWFFSEESIVNLEHMEIQSFGLHSVFYSENISDYQKVNKDRLLIIKDIPDSDYFVLHFHSDGKYFSGFLFFDQHKNIDSSALITGDAFITARYSGEIFYLKLIFNRGDEKSSLFNKIPTVNQFQFFESNPKESQYKLISQELEKKNDLMTSVVIDSPEYIKAFSYLPILSTSKTIPNLYDHIMKTVDEFMWEVLPDV